MLFKRIWTKLGENYSYKSPGASYTARGPKKQPESVKNQLLCFLHRCFGFKSVSLFVHLNVFKLSDLLKLQSWPLQEGHLFKGSNPLIRLNKNFIKPKYGDALINLGGSRRFQPSTYIVFDEQSESEVQHILQENLKISI